MDWTTTIVVINYMAVYLYIYGSTALVDLGRSFSFVISFDIKTLSRI
jgi:hypothetical protein